MVHGEVLWSIAGPSGSQNQLNLYSLFYVFIIFVHIVNVFPVVPYFNLGISPFIPKVIITFLIFKNEGELFQNLFICYFKICLYIIYFAKLFSLPFPVMNHGLQIMKMHLQTKYSVCNQHYICATDICKSNWPSRLFYYIA